jgi:predicted O-methyltransferase YrrM
VTYDSSHVQQWERTDEFLASTLLADDPDLASALDSSEAAGLPQIQVSALQGAFLELLVRTLGAQRVLEIGTLGGYSTLWLERGLGQGGSVVTLEVDEHHARTARTTFAAAGVADRIDVRVAPATESLGALQQEVASGAVPFDLVFIDADKARMPQYFVASMSLVRPGALIVADNVVRGGRTAQPELAETDADVRGVREMLALVSGTPGLLSTALQTVGSKGYDGFALVLVEDPAAAREHHRD